MNALHEHKQLATLAAQFALKGWTVSSQRYPDGRVTHQIARQGQSRVFTHPHDVVAFLNQIGGLA